MLLTPYPVLPAFTVAVIVGILVGLWWLWDASPLQRLFRRMHVADPVLLYLGFVAVQHALALQERPQAEAALEGRLGVLLVAGGVVMLLILRRFLRQKRPELLLGAALLVWGFSLGASYEYLLRLEADREWMSNQPTQVWHAPADYPQVWQRLAWAGMAGPESQKVLALMLAEETELPPVLRAYLRLYFWEDAQQVYQQEHERLSWHLGLEAAALVVLLLVWGFGRLPTEAEPLTGLPPSQE